jgi:hypothetical protein
MMEAGLVQSVERWDGAKHDQLLGLRARLLLSACFIARSPARLSAACPLACLQPFWLRVQNQEPAQRQAPRLL